MFSRVVEPRILDQCINSPCVEITAKTRLVVQCRIRYFASKNTVHCDDLKKGFVKSLVFEAHGVREKVRLPGKERDFMAWSEDPQTTDLKVISHR